MSTSESESLPEWHPPTKSSQGRRNSFFHPFNNLPGMGILTFSSFLIGLIFYTAVLSPQGPRFLNSPESYGPGLSRPHASPTQYLRYNKSTPANHASSSPELDEAPSPFSDVLSLEQIRDIVGTTRGFYARYFSLYLGWNNVSIRRNLIRAELMIQKKMQYILEASLHQASLLNRALVIPTFVYARACEYHMYVFFFWFTHLARYHNSSSSSVTPVQNMQ